MASRQRQWAAKKRLELRRLLGMKCAACGSRDYRKLEFDLIRPEQAGEMRGKHHRIEWSWRMSFYFKMWKNGNLQLLCGGVNSCHNRKTYEENYQSGVRVAGCANGDL